VAATDRLEAEHRLLAQGCGLLDRSERGKLALTGAGAKPFLNGLVTNDVEALEPGRGCYAAVLTHKGKMLADLRILDAGDELLLDTERTTLQELFNTLRRGTVGHDAELHKRTVECGLVSLVGPRARVTCAAPDLAEDEHVHVDHEVEGIPVRLVVTDVGVDALCDAAHTERLWEALERRGAQPVSEEAVECLRIEQGRPRYGLDMDESTIPQEAGINERAVSFTKGCYVGQETVARLHYKGKPNRHLRGLRLSEPARRGDPVRLGDREVGRLGSTAVSRSFGAIGLALLRREAEPGAQVEVGDSGAAAEVVELPFAPVPD
jgi:folate-binding protein YgfZ